MNNSTAYKKLDELYSRLPKIECQGLCQDSCVPVGGLASKLENKRVLDTYGKGPKRPPHPGMCQWLSLHGRCMAYSHRPLICRLYGVTAQMRCKHGCRPEKVLTFEEARDLWAESIAIGGAS
jgi:Fe-S-cluster containining protein